MIFTGDIEKYDTGFKRIKDWFKSYPNLKFQVNNMQDFVQVIISGVTTKENVPLNERKINIIQDLVKDKIYKTNKIGTAIQC